MPTGKLTAAQLKALELPFMFAGLEQWRLNQSGHQADVAANPALQDVTKESPVHDKNARTLLQNRKNTSKDKKFWKTLVPEWAAEVRTALAKQGIPFSVELLGSPEINLEGKPLFEKGGNPDSLIGVSGGSRGELNYLRSLDAKTLLLEVGPLNHRYHHRGEGKPVPADIPAGLTFGAYPSGGVMRSPITELPSYKAYQAAGSPE